MQLVYSEAEPLFLADLVNCVCSWNWPFPLSCLCVVLSLCHKHRSLLPSWLFHCGDFGVLSAEISQDHLVKLNFLNCESPGEMIEEVSRTSLAIVLFVSCMDFLIHSSMNNHDDGCIPKS